MRGFLGESISGLALRGEPFEQVAQEDWASLVIALWSVRPAEIIETHLKPEIATYVCVEWSASDLLSCRTLPGFGATAYYRFLALPARKRRDGSIDPDDPRHVASTIPFEPAYTVTGPLIAIEQNEIPILFEGYLRSILWLRAPEHPLPVWMPAQSKMALALQR